MKKNSNYPWPNWMGIRGFYFVWHGEWSDPEIVWHGYAMNMHDIQDVVWEQFCDYAYEQGIEENDDNFEQFCKDEKRAFEERRIQNLRAGANNDVYAPYQVREVKVV